MAAQNLGKRLFKELKREGKKSAILAVLLAGGACLWLPNVWKSIARRPSSSTAAGSSSTAAGSATRASTPTAPKTPPVATPSHSGDAPASTGDDWTSLRSRLDNASLIQPVPLDELVRDPFSRDWIRTAETTTKNTAAPVAPPPVDPIHTLICSSTIVGPSFRAAIIDNEFYEVGQMVPADGPVQYMVKDILKDQVLLERDGKVTPLKVPDRITIKAQEERR